MEKRLSQLLPREKVSRSQERAGSPEPRRRGWESRGPVATCRVPGREDQTERLPAISQPQASTGLHMGVSKVPRPGRNNPTAHMGGRGTGKDNFIAH